MKRVERNPLEEMLRAPELEPANDNTQNKSAGEQGEKKQEPPPLPEGRAKNTYKRKDKKEKDGGKEPPLLPEKTPEAEEDEARKQFFAEQKKIFKEQKNKKRAETESKRRDAEKREREEEQKRKEFHEEAHEEIARKNFFKKAKGEDTSDENKIAETREKINNLDLTEHEKESKLSEMKKMIKEKYDINLNAWANPEEEADAKKMNRLGDILKGENPENMGFFKRLFIGISEKERMQAKSFKNDYDAYSELADEIAEVAEQPRRGKKKNQLPPIETPPKYQWI